MEYLITIVIANVLIGGMIGMTGIAGFLLPMLYSGFLGMPSVQGLALSFFAFLISGVLGAYNYYRAKHLDLKLAVWISAGSFVGAIGGVRLNLLIEEDMVKKILYLVVLLSGISILLRKESEDTKKNDRPGQKIPPLFWLAFGAEVVLCWQALCARDLWEESMAVCRELRRGDLPAARRAVGMIVGRDTAALTPEGVARAAVETVAENTSDGVAAPLFWMALGGAPLAMAYKAVNTMDSMVGYRNDRYRWFGTAAARLDDLANWLPSRLCALVMAALAPLAGLDGRGAFRIWRRDRRKHKSPNSAQTEAAMAGALGVELAGDASYFGVVHHKPTLGDPLRPVEPEDIPRAGRLMLLTSGACCLLAAGLRWWITVGMR